MASLRPARRAMAGLAFVLVASACAGSDDDGAAVTEATAGGDVEGETDGSDAPEPPATEPPATEPPATEPPATDGATAEPVDSGVDEAEVTAPVAGGTLRYGVEAEVDGLNPTSSALSAPGLTMANAVFDTLTAYGADDRAVPYLAERVEPVDGDVSTWRVTLRDGITFHDGTRLDAAAVVANFEAQRADLLVGLAVRPFYPPIDSGVAATEIVDDLTVQFNLLDANAFWPNTLASQLGMVASPAWLAAAADDPTLNQVPVGTGPFVFDSRSQDSVTRFVRNDDWWNGEVLLDAVEFFPVTDPDTRSGLLLTGDLDALQGSTPAALLDLLDDDDVQNVVEDVGGTEDFVMVNSAEPPFDDLRVRQALTAATPLENYRQLIGLGVERPADQRFVPESPFYNPAVSQEGDDPDTAVELVAAYCADVPERCTDGRVDMEYQWSGPSVVQDRIAELLEQGWGVAFNVAFDLVPEDEHIQQVALGQYDVVTWQQFGAPDPSEDNVWLECRTVGAISLNWPRLCDPDRDALLLEAQATTDPAARQALYQQVSQMMHDAYTYVFLTHTLRVNSFAADVRGACDHTAPDGTPLRCAVNGRTWHSAVWFDPT